MFHQLLRRFKSHNASMTHQTKKGGRIHIGENDAAQILKQTQIETKSLLNRLSRIVISEDTLHKTLFEGQSQILECLAND